MSIALKIDMPEGAFSALRMDPDGLAKELRLAAAVKWFEIGIISQEKAAEIAGLSRAEFIFCLSRFNVSPFQYTIDEIREELKRGI
ncbi:MAG: putative small protein [Deltaproteobacteria bacterium]|nr:putative small protein [Deltaproteobacteria bacterium]